MKRAFFLLSAFFSLLLAAREKKPAPQARPSAQADTPAYAEQKPLDLANFSGKFTGAIFLAEGSEREVRALSDSGEVVGIDAAAMLANPKNAAPFWILDDVLKFGRTDRATLVLEYTRSEKVPQYKEPLPYFAIQDIDHIKYDYEIVSVRGYYVGGKGRDRQVFKRTESGALQITHFASGETLSNSGVYVSPDGSQMAVCHRPAARSDWLVTLYDLKTGTVIAETDTETVCRGIRWTKNFILYEFATSGGGHRYRYLDKRTLAHSHTIAAYKWFEDMEGNVLLSLPLFSAENGEVAAYEYDSGKRLRSFSFEKRLGSAYYGIRSCAKTGFHTYRLEAEPYGGESKESVFVTLKLDEKTAE